MKNGNFCRTRGYPFEQCQLFRPWMLSMMLTMQELARIECGGRFRRGPIFYQRALRTTSPPADWSAEDQLIFLIYWAEGMANEQVGRNSGRSLAPGGQN